MCMTKFDIQKQVEEFYGEPTEVYGQAIAEQEALQQELRRQEELNQLHEAELKA